MNFPTARQIKSLKDYGVIPAPTGAACSGMIAYIREFPWGRKSRAAILRGHQDEFIGKRVRYHNLAGKGTVRLIRVKHVQWRGWLFLADVSWDGMLHVSTVFLKSLELCP